MKTNFSGTLFWPESINQLNHLSYIRFYDSPTGKNSQASNIILACLIIIYVIEIRICFAPKAMNDQLLIT